MLILLSNISWFIGSVLVCYAFWLVSSGRAHPGGTAHQLPNAIGAVLMMFGWYADPSPRDLMAEGVWLGIALFTWAQGARRKNQ